jgi:hypothetical protein
VRGRRRAALSLSPLLTLLSNWCALAVSFPCLQLASLPAQPRIFPPSNNSCHLNTPSELSSTIERIKYFTPFLGSYLQSCSAHHSAGGAQPPLLCRLARPARRALMRLALPAKPRCVPPTSRPGEFSQLRSRGEGEGGSRANGGWEGRRAPQKTFDLQLCARVQVKHLIYEEMKRYCRRPITSSS